MHHTIQETTFLITPILAKHTQPSSPHHSFHPLMIPRYNFQVFRTVESSSISVAIAMAPASYSPSRPSHSHKISKFEGNGLPPPLGIRAPPAGEGVDRALVTMGICAVYASRDSSKHRMRGSLAAAAVAAGVQPALPGAASTQPTAAPHRCWHFPCSGTPTHLDAEPSAVGVRLILPLLHGRCYHLPLVDDGFARVALLQSCSGRQQG